MTFAVLMAVLLLAGVLFFMLYYYSVLRPRKGTLDWVALQDNAPFTFAVKRHPMERKDALAALLLTLVYALTAFFSLGDFTAPQDCYDFGNGQSYTIRIEGDAVYAAKLWSYAALGTGGYNLEISPDGQDWSTLWLSDEDKSLYWAQAEGFAPSYALAQDYNKVFKWTETAPTNPQYVRYIRISGRPDKEVLQLGKLLLVDHNDQIVPFNWTLVDGQPQDQQAFARIFAVDDTVPETISWRNSAYFDEIYHPRTALEHIQKIYPYENTHPPLGKLIIGLGVRMFGMTGFGWRFMGVLFGTLMVPALYLFLKNMFGKTPLAVCGTALLCSEFMHLTQTRIATIDTYGVFFTLVSYLFFYRWLTASATPKKNGKTGEGYGDLALSGILWGVGCACKWTVIYAGAGLAFLYLLHMIARIRAWDRAADMAGLRAWLVKTLSLSVLCYVLIPAVIYTAAYIPYAQATGNLSVAGVVDEMWRNQRHMLNYHNGVHSTHPYSSRWYQWLVDARPILYYSKYLPNGTAERFAAFTNPLITWAGLLAVLTCVSKCFRRTKAKLAVLWSAGVGCALVCWLVGRVENGDFDPALGATELSRRLVLMVLCLLVYLGLSAFIALQTQSRSSGRDVFISVGFAAQFLPWVFIARTTFAYHYFPSTIFLILAICCVFSDLMELPRGRWKLPVYGFTAVSVGLYLLFYPVLTGLTMSTWYSETFLKFLPSWPI